MFKIIVLLKRRHGLLPEQFRAHWVDVHGPLVRQTVPGIRRYVQNHIMDEDREIDGIAELWFDDEAGWEECRRFGASPAAEPIHADEDRFLDRAAMRFFVVAEKEIS